MKIESIQNHFTVGFPVQTTVRTVDLLGIEVVLMWKLSWYENSVNLLREEKGECAALALKTSNDSWIKINMHKFNGWISLHSKQLNVLCLNQMSETKQNINVLFFLWTNCSEKHVALERNWDRSCLCII